MTAATSETWKQFTRGARFDIVLWVRMVALVGGSLLAAFDVTATLALLLDLAIAFLKVGIILAFFMKLRGARALIPLTCLYASIFVVVIFVLTFDDLFTRV